MSAGIRNPKRFALGWGPALVSVVAALVAIAFALSMQRENRSLKMESSVEVAEPQPGAVSETNAPTLDQTHENDVTPSSPRSFELELIEARMAAESLVEENHNLEQEVLDLRERLSKVSASHAETLAVLDQTRNDIEKDSSSRPAWDEEGAAEVPSEVAVLEFNESLNMIVLDGGLRDGLRTGMIFSVMKDGHPVARIRLADVRERLCGAVVEAAKGGVKVERGDRAIPWSSTENR